LLGSTGSIGRSALNVLDRHADEFRVVALAANRNARELAGQVARYAPQLAVLVDEEAAAANGPLPDCMRTGRQALLDAAAHPDADIVINAVVGAAGLEATLAALRSGKRLALANKESLVAGGPLVREALRSGGGELVPVDSEHSAILQCIGSSDHGSIRRMILTASGGPFRGWTADRLAGVTPEQALRHPTWDMGAKITIDSATLANKALEVIEAHFLFDTAYDDIDVVVHPQSIIHSMLEFVDGSVLAQLGFPTMELPILYALTHPARRTEAGGRRFDPTATGPLTFEPVDGASFRAFTLGVQAGRTGGTAPAVFNAANEVAVAGFLRGGMPFGGIADVIDCALQAYRPVPADSIENVMDADRRAREAAGAALRRIC
ncbi:MAG TPA: 1-deoxy-D-xylulose-5-phosphate reductoisomerase, partial [Longimicrobiales bacterium]|nr:1-deoxy-D-xylulose-5-phosphate reductoisomerase [Longimicrobiales bacterium]